MTLRVRRRRRRGPGRRPERAGRERRPHHARQRSSGGDRGAARVPGRDGARDRRRGAVVGDRAARPARQPGPATLRARHAVADARDRRDAHARADRRRGAPEDRDPGEANSTQIGNLAKASVSHGLFAFFQLATALLLLAAASSSFPGRPRPAQGARAARTRRPTVTASGSSRRGWDAATTITPRTGRSCCS